MVVIHRKVLCVLAFVFLLTEAALSQSEATPGNLSQLSDPRGLGNPVYRWNAKVISVPGKPADADMIDNDYATARYGKPWDFNDNTAAGIKYFSDGILDRQVKDGKLMFGTGKRAYFYWGNFREGDKFQEEDIRFNHQPPYQPRASVKTKLQIRLKQSMDKSHWKATVKMGERNYLQTSEFIVSGTEWQTIEEPILASCNDKISSLAIFPGDPGNNIEIDWVKIINPQNNSYVRKKINLPDPIKNSEMAFITSDMESYSLYINGKLVCEGQQDGPTRAVINTVDCGKFMQKGENVIAYRQSSSTDLVLDGKIAIEGIIKLVDGNFIRIFTNDTWLCTYTFSPGWMEASFNDGAWKKVKEEQNVAQSILSLHPENTSGFGLLADPPYFGPIEIKTNKQGEQIFQQQSGVKLDVELPLQCKVDFEYTDASTGKIIASGALPGTTRDGVYCHPFFIQPPEAGVYNLKISAYHQDKLLDTRFYETVVVGKIPQQEALLKDIDSAVKLELVDEIFCGDAKEKHDFVDGSMANDDHKNTVTNTSKIEEIGGKLFRSLGARHGDWFSYRFTVKNKYLPHIIDIEFNDDREGMLISRVTETARKTYYNTGDVGMMRCSASVATGGAFKPPTGKIQSLKLFYIPSYAEATIDLINGGHYDKPGMPVYRVRVYELKEMPALKVSFPSGRLFGMSQERYPIAIKGFYGGSAAESFVGFEWGQFQHKHFGFYQKHYQAVANQIKWMRFCGENLWFPAVWMYAGPFYPTNLVRSLDNPHDDYIELMLRMFGENGLHMMPMFEFAQNGSGGQIFPCKPVTNTEVALGASTNKIVQKDGTQTVASNICHPDVQKRYCEIVRDFMDRYGGCAALQGIGIYAGPARLCLEPMVTEFDFNENPEEAFDGSYDDMTMEQFEKFLGRDIPVDKKDIERFGKRYEWIKQNARKEFIEFRCQKLSELHRMIRNEVTSKHPVKEYWPVHFLPAPYKIEAMRKKGIGVRDIYRHFGIDPELYKKQGKMLAAIQKGTPTWQYDGMNQRISEAVTNFWQESDDFQQTWNNGDATLFFLRNGFDEIMTSAPVGKKWYWGPWNISKVDASVNEAHRYFARYMTNCLLKTTPKVIVSGGIQDELLSTLGHYDRQWHFAAPFRSIPFGEYQTLTGSGLDKKRDGQVVGKRRQALFLRRQSLLVGCQCLHQAVEGWRIA